jgi:hypothetical protein
MKPPVSRHRRKGKHLRIGRRYKLNIKDVDGFCGRRTDRLHHFVVACEQRCGDGSQQLPVVHGTQRLRIAVDPRNSDHRSGNLRTTQHPPQELRRQQRHIDRQKHVERSGARRERCFDSAQRSASGMQICNGVGPRTGARDPRRSRQWESAKLIQRNVKQRSPTQLEQCFIPPHARAAASGQHKTFSLSVILTHPQRIPGCGGHPLKVCALQLYFLHSSKAHGANQSTERKKTAISCSLIYWPPVAY